MIQIGVYAITDPKRTHYICGKMCAGGNVPVTADMVGDKHLAWLIETRALVFVGKAAPMPAPAPPPVKAVRVAPVPPPIPHSAPASGRGSSK